MNWRVVAASVCGRSHERTNSECQDDHNSAMVSPGIMVAAIADGAGSAELGHIGARIATQASVDTILEQDPPAADGPEDAWREVLLAAVASARSAIEAEAGARGRPLTHLATTLLLLLASDRLVGLAQVGDGAAVILDQERGLSTLSAPERGEYVNETVFLTASGESPRARVVFHSGTPLKVALFSDGLEFLALKMPEATPHEPFFLPLFQYLDECPPREAEEELASFLRSPRITERVDDDITLLVASALR